MTFAQPIWFWALALVPALLALFVRNEFQARQLVAKLVAARLQQKLTGNVSLAKRRMRFGLILLGLVAAIIALAQPQFGFTEETSRRKGRDLLIAIDTSKSMMATDLAPNRLTRAKLAAEDLISQLGGDRIGLIAFAGTAFLQAPLTIDHNAILGAVHELDPDIIPQGGTNIAAAISMAKEAFGKGESQHRALIIFTDGEDLEASGKQAAAELKDAVTIFTVGIGSAEGSLIPLPNGRGGEFVKDSSGQIVKSRLDEASLTEMASSTGGFYIHLDSGPEAARRIIRDGLGKMGEHEIDAKLSRRPIERYYWPLAFSVLALVASTFVTERKSPRPLRRAATLAVLLLVWLPLQVHAKNHALEAYEREDYPGALKGFSSQLTRRPDSPALHLGIGSAAYKTGDFETALKSFAQAATARDGQVRSRAEYNLGNTLFKRGEALEDKPPKIQEWKNALQHYDQALQVDPKNTDAKFNRELVDKMIQELEKEPPKQDQKDQKQDKQDKDKEKKEGKDKQDQKDDSKGEPKDQKEDSKDKQDPSGKDKDPKDGKNQKEGSGEKPDQSDSKDKQAGSKGDQDKENPEKKDEGKPQPDPGKPDKKQEGELKNSPQYDKGKEAEPQQQEAEAQAAAEGRMTEQQAQNLFESLRGEDQKVQLMDPSERRAKTRIFKDW